eukprot:CAMPEP_0118709778 /NCGR_PEP_ID=MMETSP0800-20121206/22894_1 /TAXON_ID=210618 ORGANISM="Striatella unipunctata, Strain CCMP2910" /NCGR_SAMPLE_ID=MMETSP0800 /ASSEMBLY_ACC=CAM_ASM_000638 /LENGTH=171 /DNA_ID=CAMNT_0006613645 /DNA_START=325 /DNA_END=840 /DNA_ORIENTATION=+
MGNCAPSFHAASELERQEDKEREEGREALRAMVTGGDEVDWAAVIAKAKSLHAREQDILSRRSKRERRFRRRYRKKLLQQRKKQDMNGSFSVNLLTLRPDGRDEFFQSFVDLSAVAGVAESSATMSTRDDQSHDSSFNASVSNEIMFFKSWEEAMTRIDERPEECWDDTDP